MDTSANNLFGNVSGLDEKSCRSLTEALLRNNLKGFDYLEFRASLRALAHLDMDKAQAFKSAFATASVLGLTRDHLISSINHYKTVLSNEKEAFDQAHRNQVSQQLQAREKEIKALESDMDTFKGQIAALEDKIAQCQTLMQQKQEQMKDAEVRIESTRKHFDHALAAIQVEMDGDVAAIDLYLS